MDPVPADEQVVNPANIDDEVDAIRNTSRKRDDAAQPTDVGQNLAPLEC